MGVIQDNEYVLYKSLIGLVKNGIKKPLNLVKNKVNAEFLRYDKQKSMFLDSETYVELGENSKKLNSLEKSFISLLAVQERLEEIFRRNEQRELFVNEKLGVMGIYNDQVDKKLVASTLQAQSKNVSEESLNLNPSQNGNLTFKFFAGEILAFKENSLDFSLPENASILQNGSQDFFHEVIQTFPYSVATIPDHAFMNSALKNRILKECIIFVASKLKNQSISESNAMLGGLLKNCSQITKISNYASELKNYFNVIAKQSLIKRAPDLEKEINSALKCDETSIYLPVARIRNEPIQEESVTEESSLSQEELLNLLLDDDDILAEIEKEEQEEQEENKITEESGAEAQQSIEDELEKALSELEELFATDDDSEGDKVDG